MVVVVIYCSVVRVQSVTTMLTTVRTPLLIDRPSRFLAEKGLGDAYLATRGCTLDVDIIRYNFIRRLRTTRTDHMTRLNPYCLSCNMQEQAQKKQAELIGMSTVVETDQLLFSYPELKTSTSSKEQRSTYEVETQGSGKGADVVGEASFAMPLAKDS